MHVAARRFAWILLTAASACLLPPLRAARDADAPPDARDAAEDGSACPSGGCVALRDLSAGDQSSCVRGVDGEVRCWGRNALGQLGDGTSTNRLRPVVITGLRGATQLALGEEHGCARMPDGTVRCWGNNADGQLGTGDTRARDTPTAVPGLAGVVQLAAGFRHVCARTQEHRVFCWGNNLYGQLGDGTTTPRRAPTSVRW